MKTKKIIALCCSAMLAVSAMAGCADKDSSSSSGKDSSSKGKDMKIESHLLYEERINDWRVDDLHCRVLGFKELADDLLKIAYLMKDKPANGVYDLDRLLDESKELIYKDNEDNYKIK